MMYKQPSSDAQGHIHWATDGMRSSPAQPRAYLWNGNRRDTLTEKRVLNIVVVFSLIWLASFVIGFKTSLMIITLASFALAAIGLKFPLYGLVGVGILCGLDAMTRVFLTEAGWFRYNTFNYWLMLVFLVALPIHLRQRDIHTWLMRGLAFLLIAELVFTPTLELGIWQIVNFVTVFGLFVYPYRCRHNPRMWYVMAMAVGLNSAFAGVAFYLNTEGLTFFETENELRRLNIWNWDFIDPNALSYVFVTAVIVITMGITSNSAKRHERLLLMVLFAMNLCWTLLTGSRGAMLVASACTLNLLYSARSTSRRFQIIAFGVLSFLVVANTFPQYMDRAFHRVDKLVDDKLSAAQRTSARSDMAVGAWRLFLESPLGVGTGGFEECFSQLRDTSGFSAYSRGKKKSAHSAWLKVLAENGVPGIILLTAVVLSFAYAGIQTGTASGIATGLLVTFVMTSTFLTSQFQPKGVWFVVASGIVYLHHRKHNGNSLSITFQQLKPDS